MGWDFNLWWSLPWTLTLFNFILLLSTSLCQFDSSEEENTEAPFSCQVTINKCSEIVTEDSFIIPEKLKLPVSSLSDQVVKEDTECIEQFSENTFQFQLELNDVSCNFTKEIKIPWGNYVSQNKTGDEDKNKKPEGKGKSSSRYYFTHQGYFQRRSTLMEPQDYCISALMKGNLKVKTCVLNTKQNVNHNTINKCCPPDHVIKLDSRNPNERECVEIAVSPGNMSESWNPYLYKKLGEGKFQMVEDQDKAMEHMRMEYKLPECNDSKIRTPHLSAVGHQRALIRITDYGRLYTRSSGNHKWVAQNSRKKGAQILCVDGLWDTNSAVEFERSEENVILIHCEDHHVFVTHNVSTLAFIHITMMVLCCIFLIGVVITYALVCDRQNIHGWTVATYCFCMLSFLIFKITADCYRIKNHGEDVSNFQTGTASCYAMGVTIHFFFVSMFSWMTVINFDLWFTIGSIRPVKGRDDEKGRFLLYSAFGFGIPIFIISISLLIDHHFDFFDDTVIRPQYGHSKCGLDKTALLYYEVLVSLILFGASLLISCFTLKFLLIHIQQAKRLQKAMQHSKRNNLYEERGRLLSKVFVLLAFSWIFEIGGIIWTFQEHNNRWYVVLFDMHNFIQSVGFFVIFVYKKEIQQQLRMKYRIFEGAFSWLEEKFHTHSETITMTTHV